MRLVTVLSWLAAGLLVALRWTVRIRFHDDPRPALRAAGRRYVYAILHAQQLSFVLLSDDVPIAAMVSASKDGDALVPLCRVRGIVPIRGSTRKKGKDKGGRAALALMGDFVREHDRPALLAVDGPRGPRSTVHWGVVDLARELDACILVAGVFPTRRWLLKRAWDRTQLPLPFCRLDGRFRPPIDTRDIPDRTALRERVAAELLALEQAFDPAEARFAVGIPPVE